MSARPERRFKIKDLKPKSKGGDVEILSASHPFDYVRTSVEVLAYAQGKRRTNDMVDEGFFRDDLI